MASPLVSVIMPAYNCQEVLPYAIESVLSQTNPTFELIIIDDASTDATLSIIEAYARRDCRVHVVRNNHNSRQGPIQWESRNDGLKLVSGRFVAYLDADNAWHPNFIEKLSRCLIADDKLQVVYCDSCNHYSDAEANYVIATDPRQLVAYGANWTVFSHEVLSRARLGKDQYVDTNEMMHRTSVFERLGVLWRTVHPHLDKISDRIGAPRPARRRNDLDLFERIIDTFGIQSTLHLREPLVDYYYPSAVRPSLQLTRASHSDPVHPQIATNVAHLNVNHFFDDYLRPREGLNRFDFGLGDIHIPDLDLSNILMETLEKREIANRLVIYNGFSTIRNELQAVAEYYARQLGQVDFGIQNLIPFDGCHEAIGSALDMFAGTSGNPAGKDAFAYAVPSYPYWTIGATGRHRAIPIEAFDVDEYIDGLAKLQDRDVGAVVVQWPNNPLGYCYNKNHIDALNSLARERGWGIIADITYDTFIPGLVTTGVCDLAPEITVLCTSVSKSWGIPGLRLGFGISANVKLAAVLRAYKSGRSLLPSSFKLILFSHILRSYPDLPRRIREVIHERRNRLRHALSNSIHPDLGMEISSEFRPGLYEVLKINKLCNKTSITPLFFAQSLLIEKGVRVTSDNAFYPSDFGKTPRERFIRMSVGRSDDLEAGVNLICDYLTTKNDE